MSTAVTASCPPGRVLLGGGATVTGISGVERVGLVISAPNAGGTGWQAAVQAYASNSNVTVTAYAVCTT